MKRIKWLAILLNLIFLLIFFNWSVKSKENTLSKGRLVLLELEPVDPRSLIQGDYMRLRYAITNYDNSTNVPERGYLVAKAGPNGVAVRVRFQEGTEPLADDEFLIKYFNRSLRLGAESYFFEEGKASKLDAAKYGGLRVDEQGNSILIGLYDELFRKIE